MRSQTSSSRSYGARTLKILWGRAAGRCAVPTCRIELFADATEHDPIVVIGDIAHIEAASDYGPRANRRRATRARDEYENLILLCKNCHIRLDGQKHTNTLEMIIQLRHSHESWVRASLPERGRGTTGWTPLFLQGRQPIDAVQALAALSPDFPAGDAEVITIDPERHGWETTYSEIAYRVEGLHRDCDSFERRIAIFPLAPISACTALGYLVTSRPRVRLFQHHRDEQLWSWPIGATTGDEFIVDGLPEMPVQAPGHLAICFHLSARIQEDQIARAEHRFAQTVHVSVPRPSSAWLQTEAQLRELARVSRGVFENCLACFPVCDRWHLFHAGPAPAAVVVGQQLSPTMIPEVQLYEFKRTRASAYEASLLLR